MKAIRPLLFALLLLPAGCGESAEAADARDEIREALDAIGNYTEMEFERVVDTLRGGWSKLEKETDALMAEAKERGVDIGDTISAALAEAEAKFEEASKSGADNAKESLRLAGQALEEAKAAVDEAWKKLRK